MDRYITKSKYFSPDFNTAIFADPIRIYFSSEHESQALELYFKLQSRKERWETYLRQRGQDNYCYLMLYRDGQQFSSRFETPNLDFAPGEMGEDLILGLRVPMTPETVDHFLRDIDQRIGVANLPESV